MFWTAIHAVDRTHAGKDDSSVMYIPACPLTEANAAYLARQRETFYEGISPPGTHQATTSELTDLATQERQVRTSPQAQAKASI